MNSSARGIPDARTAAPTSASLRYTCAESTCLYVARASREYHRINAKANAQGRAPVAGGERLEGACGRVVVLIDAEAEARHLVARRELHGRGEREVGGCGHLGEIAVEAGLEWRPESQSGECAEESRRRDGKREEPIFMLSDRLILSDRTTIESLRQRNLITNLWCGRRRNSTLSVHLSFAHLSLLCKLPCPCITMSNRPMLI